MSSGESGGGFGERGSGGGCGFGGSRSGGERRFRWSGGGPGGDEQVRRAAVGMRGRQAAGMSSEQVFSLFSQKYLC